MYFNNAEEVISVESISFTEVSLEHANGRIFHEFIIEDPNLSRAKFAMMLDSFLTAVKHVNDSATTSNVEIIHVVENSRKEYRAAYVLTDISVEVFASIHSKVTSEVLSKYNPKNSFIIFHCSSNIRSIIKIQS